MVPFVADALWFRCYFGACQNNQLSLMRYVVKKFIFCSAQTALLGRILPLLFAVFMALLLGLQFEFLDRH